MLDNADAANWSGSVNAGGTPLAVNSQVGLDLATISNVPDPNDIAPSQAVLVTAEVAGVGITAVQLKYVVNFDAEQTLTMYDDGSNGDVTPGDDVYTAEIPGQAEKSLVRFRVLVTNASGTQQSPNIDDSQDYHGYYIRPTITTNAEVLDWFIEDSAYTDMVTNHTQDNLYFDGVVAYGNDVYDNAKFRVRGDVSRNIDKKSFKVKLPAGYEVDIDGGTNIPTDEFELLHGTYYSTALNATLSWMNDQAGLPSTDMIVTRLERNGEFHGLFTWSNKYQAKWRIANGFNTGELYEDTSEVVSGATDSSRITSFSSMMLNGEDVAGTAQLNKVLDNYDIPNIISFMTTLGVVGGSDHIAYNNTLQYYETNTGRWKGLLWDQEGTFHKEISISPYDARGSEFSLCYPYCAPYNHPSLREIYLRRFRTVVDKLYGSDQLLEKFTELETIYEDDTLLDMTVWPDDAAGNPRMTPTEAITNFTILTKDRKRVFLSYATGLDWGLPDAQLESDEQQVSLDAIIPSATDADEYIRLYNGASTPVDISGWVIEGIDYTLPDGAVIPAQGEVYLLRDDIGYKASHDPVLAMGQYGNDLGGSGTLVLKNSDGTTIDSEGY